MLLERCYGIPRSTDIYEDENGVGDRNNSNNNNDDDDNDDHHRRHRHHDQIVVKKAMMEKKDLVIGTAGTSPSFLSLFGMNNRNPSTISLRKPLHHERTNKSISEELEKRTTVLQDERERDEMLRVVTYCKSEDSFLVNDLNQLSMKEREMVLQDIHGVSDYQEELDRLTTTNTEWMEKTMEEMEVEIQKYLLESNSNNNNSSSSSSNLKKTTSSSSSSSKTATAAYTMAKEQSMEYVQDWKRKLLFLRAEQMNIVRAAHRYVEFFEQKLLLFGPERLCTDISLKDFTTEDMEFLSQGSFQLLPTRDRAGRAVMVHLPTFMKWRQHENMLRSVYYLLMSALDDEETQKKGIIFVFSRFGPIRPVPDSELTQKSLNLFSSLPIRICGWHYCTDDRLFSLLFPLVGNRFEKQARVRLRVHYGSYIECSYILMTFGIPVMDFPITDDLQDLKRQKHQKWISIRRNLELKRRTINRSGSSSSGSESDKLDNNNINNNNDEYNNYCVTLLPSHSDILFGRGKPVQEHPGNLSLGVLIESLLPKYSQCKGKKQKMEMTHNIVLDIKRRGGRFLQQEVDGSGVWVEVEDEMARSKVSHTFRNKKQELLALAKTAAKGQQPQQQPQTSKRPRAA